MAKTSWWDGLQKRLWSRGLFDPFAARHVRDDFVPFYLKWREGVDKGADPVASFRRIFLGHNLPENADVPDAARGMATGPERAGEVAQQVGQPGPDEHHQRGLQLVCSPVSPG